MRNPWANWFTWAAWNVTHIFHDESLDEYGDWINAAPRGGCTKSGGH